MTVYTLMAPVPDLPLPGGTVLKFEAISPTSGAAITGVTVSQVAVYGDDLGAISLVENPGPFMLVPGPESVAGAGGDGAPSPTQIVTSH